MHLKAHLLSNIPSSVQRRRVYTETMVLCVCATNDSTRSKDFARIFDGRVRMNCTERVECQSLIASATGRLKERSIKRGN